MRCILLVLTVAMTRVPVMAFFAVHAALADSTSGCKGIATAFDKVGLHISASFPSGAAGLGNAASQVDDKQCGVGPFPFF